MTRINIGPRDRISDAGSDYRLVAATDSGVLLARVGDSGAALNQSFTYRQIKEAIDANLIRIDRGWFEEGRCRARLMAGASGLSELPRAEVNEMLRERHYCDEFIKREASDRTVKRTDESIARTLQAIDAERPVEGKRCDRPEESKPRPSARTFRRWLKRYEAGGYDILALRKRHRNCGGNRASPVHPEAERIMQTFVVGYCDERRKSKKHLYGEMRAEFKRVNEEREAEGLQPLVCPAKSTLSSRIDDLNQFEVYASRYGVAKARAKFAVVGAGLDVVRPLQHIQIDEWRVQLHTIAEQIGLGDMLTEEERIALKKERLYVTVILDIATRCIVAMRISPRADSENAIATLAMVISDKNGIAKAAGCISDWPMGGAFGLISPDAGSSFIEERFRACVADLKAIYENAPASLSHLRGHIERTFGSMHTRLMGNFPGRSFSNVVDLAEYKAEDRAAVFSRHAPRIFVRWVVDFYHHTPHVGLGGETPYNAWLRLTARYGVDAPPNGHQRREIFGVDLERSLDQRGVRVAGVFYQSPKIQEWRRQVGHTKVRVRFDHFDIGHVSVWIGERWLTVPSVRELHRGLDLETWLESVRDLRRRFAEQAKLSEHIVLAAIRAISQMADGAMRRASIDATRPGADEIEREERHLLLGFEIVDDDTLVRDAEPTPKANVLDGGIPVARARPPVTPTTPTPHAAADGDYGLED